VSTTKGWFAFLCRSCSSITSGLHMVYWGAGHSWCESMLLFHRVSSMFGIVWRCRIFVEVFGLPGNPAAWTCSISFWGTQSMSRTWKRPFCTTFGTYERMDPYGVFHVFSIMRMKTTNKQQRRCSSLHDLHGSRSKTHARHLVSEWHLQIWMCIFASVAKDCERAAKGSRKVWIHLLD